MGAKEQRETKKEEDMKKRAIWLSLVLTFTPVAFAHAADLGESVAPGEGMNCAARAKAKPESDQRLHESQQAPVKTDAVSTKG